MSRTSHDEFAKDWMQEFLADFGTVQTEFQISGEVRHVDVYFEPDVDRLPAPMGILGRMITEPCLIEPFRNAIPIGEIKNCGAKATILGMNLARQAKQQRQRYPVGEWPFLWMISPTLSEPIQVGFGMHQDPAWGDGIYFRPEHDRAAVIVIHQLPVTPDTLWLRLLGRGNVQKRAIEELLALPPDYPYREITLRHITVLQKKLAARQNLSKDQRKVFMTLSISYEQIEAEILQRGIAQGREEGRQNMLTLIRAMLREGIDPATIARATQLPIEQITELANSQN